MNRVQGIIFDMDGTLLDSMQVWLTSGSDFLRRHGYPYDEEADELAKIGAMPEIGREYQKRYGVQESWQEIADDINADLAHQYREVLMPKPGVMAFLEGFRQAGIPMVLATATDRCLVEPALERVGIRPYLDGIFTTTEVGVGKHDPAIYRLGAKALGLAPGQIAVFEDALYAAATAHANGFITVGVYDRSFQKDQTRLKEISDLYFPDYTGKDVVSSLLSL